jgi:hypothetical protein
MSEFPAQLFRLEGDPGSVRASASQWSAFGTAASEAAGQITALDTSRFVGPEGDLFRDGLTESMPEHLQITGEAFGLVASALHTFAGTLDGLQEQMAPLATRAPGLWQALQAAHGRVTDAQAADQTHARHAATAPNPPTPDPYHSDTTAATAALTGAQQAWNDCAHAATGLRTQLSTAVDTCVHAIEQATGMRFKENPKWYDLGGQFTNFVRDNKDLLQQLSGGLKVVSLVAGVLSFIPILAPVMAPLAVGTALAASAIDLSVYAATGEGDLTTILVDVGLNLLPGVGKLARMGMARYGDDAARAVRAADSAPAIPAPHAGQRVYRVWGQNQDSAAHMMPSGARPGGQSWTPVNPADSPNFRVDAGLPNQNPGRFISEGVLRNPENVVEVRPALPLDGNPGGWPEYIIEDADEAVDLVRVGGVNEPWTHQPGDWVPPSTP